MLSELNGLSERREENRGASHDIDKPRSEIYSDRYFSAIESRQTGRYECDFPP